MTTQPPFRKLGRMMYAARRGITPMFSAGAVARALGVSRHTVQRWEAGVIKPAPHQLQDYCDCLMRKGVYVDCAKALYTHAYPERVVGSKQERGTHIGGEDNSKVLNSLSLLAREIRSLSSQVGGEKKRRYVRCQVFYRLKQGYSLDRAVKKKFYSALKKCLIRPVKLKIFDEKNGEITGHMFVNRNYLLHAVKVVGVLKTLPFVNSLAVSYLRKDGVWRMTPYFGDDGWSEDEPI